MKPPQSLESTDPTTEDKKFLQKIIDELDQAALDMGKYYLGRLDRCRDWWQCKWEDQSYDGRKHGDKEAEALPWENASDSRLQIIAGLVDEHMTVIKAGLRTSRLAVRSERPLVYGRAANIAQRVLEWHVHTQQRRELLRETNFVWNWKFALGLSFMNIEWEQQRAKSHEYITLESLIEVAQVLGIPELADLSDDEASEEAIQFLQSLSPILATEDAKKIVHELRNQGHSQLPVVNLSVNRPVWMGLLPGVDLLFPSEIYDIQISRFTSRRELVDEATLTDRITTDNYDPRFVEEALKHKGKFATWLTQQNWKSLVDQGSDRDMVELHHFLHRNIEDGVPCMYRTVFNYEVAPLGLSAVHTYYEYKHNQQPFVACRRKHQFRPLLTSIGLAEEAYTDEQDIKTQQDGLNDRTEIINNPPMVLPVLRAMGAKNQYGPRAVMSALRPQEVSWPPLPPSDGTPVEVITMVQQRLDRRYSIQGQFVDPQFRSMRLQELANDVFTEYELMLEQTLKLAQQYDTDEVVQKVAGLSDQPWNASTEDILGDHTISVTNDMQLTDIEYVTKRLGLYQTALQMNSAGTAKMNKLFSRIMGIVDPDAGDLIDEDEPAVTEREVNDEKQAIAQIMTGLQPVMPMHGNHALRLQTLVADTFQSPNPFVQQTIAQRQDVQELLKSRIQFFQNQIQQYQKNPQIGRTLATDAFNPKEPGQVATTSGV